MQAMLRHLMASILTLRQGEILGLVGESGCGKSVTSLSIAGLLPPNAEIVTGDIELGEKELIKLGKEEMRRVRLSEVAVIFQDPSTYLNPVLTVGSQITEILTGDAVLRKRASEA